MYRQLTKEHSLYNTTDGQIQQYIDVASGHEKLSGISEPLSMKGLDNWGVAYNIWCMFFEDVKGWQLDFTKSFAYSCNFYCLDLLRKNKPLQRFFMAYGKTDTTVFLLSYYVAVEMLYWVDEVLGRVEEGQDLIIKNSQRDYFLLHLKEHLLEDQEHELYKDQKLMVFVLADSFTKESLFDDHVQKAIQATREYLKKYTTAK